MPPYPAPPPGAPGYGGPHPGDPAYNTHGPGTSSTPAPGTSGHTPGPDASESSPGATRYDLPPYPAPLPGTPAHGAPPGYSTPSPGTSGYNQESRAPGYSESGVGTTGYGTPPYPATQPGAPGYNSPPTGYGTPAAPGMPTYGPPGYPNPGQGAPNYGAPSPSAPGYSTPPPGFGPPGYTNQPPGYGYPPAGYAPRSPYAHWVQRLGAAVIDGLIVGIPAMILDVLGDLLGFTPITCTIDMDGNRFCTGGDITTTGLVLIGLGALISILGGLYLVYMEGTTGQTPGKRVLGIRLVRESDGQVMGFGWALVRSVCHILDALPCYLGFLWPLWDEKRQTFADMIMKTVVVPV